MFIRRTLVLKRLRLRNRSFDMNAAQPGGKQTDRVRELNLRRYRALISGTGPQLQCLARCSRTSHFNRGFRRRSSVRQITVFSRPNILWRQVMLRRQFFPVPQLRLLLQLRLFPARHRAWAPTIQRLLNLHRRPRPVAYPESLTQVRCVARCSIANWDRRGLRCLSLARADPILARP